MPDNQPIPSTRGTDRHDRPLVHPVVARGGAYAWRLIGIGIVGWAALQLLTALWVLVLTAAVAMLLGRALDPVANVFRRRGLRPALVAVVTLVGFLLVMAGHRGAAGPGHRRRVLGPRADARGVDRRPRGLVRRRQPVRRLAPRHP